MCVPCKYHVCPMQVPCVSHASTMCVPCKYHVCPMQVPCVSHVSTMCVMQVPCVSHVSTMCVPCKYHVCPMCFEALEHYLNCYEGWPSIILDDRRVFAPFHFAHHWFGVLMWREKKAPAKAPAKARKKAPAKERKKAPAKAARTGSKYKYCIRVYNSDQKNYRKFEKIVAAMFAMVFNEMLTLAGRAHDQLHPLQWIFTPPFDQVQQMASSNRCGLHVMLRAYQIATGLWRIRKVTYKPVLFEFFKYMAVSLFEEDQTLCADDVIPKIPTPKIPTPKSPTPKTPDPMI